jgi:NAD(P)-dependent dehydrogenase (short-subunit alcohol dehydrogenase family)
VHAAGLLQSAPLGQLSADDGEQMWQMHMQAVSTLANALAPRLPGGGRIVLIGSRTMTGVAGKSQYAATKAALLAMARSWAAELAARCVTVNVGPRAHRNTDAHRPGPQPHAAPPAGARCTAPSGWCQSGGRRVRCGGGQRSSA